MAKLARVLAKTMIYLRLLNTIVFPVWETDCVDIVSVRHKERISPR